MSRTPSHPDPSALPPVSPWLLRAFGLYTRRYLHRHLHAVRLDTHGWIPDGGDGVPRIIYLNHAAWWDPLLCLHARNRLFPRHAAYAPIDAAALLKYPFFRRLGFFGVEPDSLRGATRFLRAANTIASQPWNTLWVTPQGRFADVRERPLAFKPGLGLLAARLAQAPLTGGSPANRVQFIPLAIEYTFWEERLPEALLRFGEPLEVGPPTNPDWDAAAWSDTLTHRLESTMDHLAVASRRRVPDRFLNLLDGSAGVGGVYDLWRRLKANLRGRTFEPRHGQL